MALKKLKIIWAQIEKASLYSLLKNQFFSGAPKVSKNNSNSKSPKTIETATLLSQRSNSSLNLY